MKEVKRDNLYGLQQFARTREEFIEFYDATFKEIVDEMEKDRQKAVKPMIQIALLIAAAAIALLFIEPGYAFLPLFFGIGVIIQRYRKHKYKLNAKLKEKVIPTLVQFMHPSFTYEPNKRLSLDEFKKASFFDHGFSRYRGEDLIQGKVVDEELGWQTAVAFSDSRVVRLSVSEDREGRTSISESTDLVRGLFYKLDFNKDFGDSVTTIVPRMIMKSRALRESMVDFKKLGMKEVKLEDPLFMEEFVVYSTDQIMSRVILQPDTMRDLRKFIQNKPVQLNGEPEIEIAPTDFSPKAIKHVLKQASKGEFHPYIPYITFRNKNMYLFYSSSKDHFAFHMFHKFSAETLYDYFKDMNNGLRLIDELNLNLKLYMK